MSITGGVCRASCIMGVVSSSRGRWDSAICWIVFALSLRGPRVPCCLLNVHEVPIAMHPAHGVVLEQRTLRTLHASQARFAGVLEAASTVILRSCVGYKTGNRAKIGVQGWGYIYVRVW